MVVLLAVL